MPTKDEGWRGAIIVIFKRGTSAERIRELVVAQGCEFQDLNDGSHHVNVIVVPKGEDEAKVAAFNALPEVKSASLNNDSVPR